MAVKSKKSIRKPASAQKVVAPKTLGDVKSQILKQLRAELAQPTTTKDPMYETWDSRPGGAFGKYIKKDD